MNMYNHNSQVVKYICGIKLDKTTKIRNPIYDVTNVKLDREEAKKNVF